MTRAEKPNHMTFTELGLLRLKPPSSGQVEYWDAGTKGQIGLRVLVSSGGTKTYRSTFYLYGKACDRSIGRVGELELAAARERVRMDRKLATEGIDPRQQMQELRKAHQITFRSRRRSIRRTSLQAPAMDMGSIAARIEELQTAAETSNPSHHESRGQGNAFAQSSRKAIQPKPIWHDRSSRQCSSGRSRKIT